MYTISIIIINYNTARYTVECISSVLEKSSNQLRYEIIVIDNNSKLKDYEYLKNNIPLKENISLHRSNINTGFGGGNMYGVQFAKSKYILFLNNDTLLKNDCIKILYNFMESHPKVAVSTAQNFDEKGKHVISFDHDKGLRKLLFGRRFLEKNNKKKYPKRKSIYTSPLTVNYVNGAFMFFRSDVFGKIGGFDTNIFLYFEEMDTSLRLRKLGYSSVLVPEAEILHYQGLSTGKSNAITKEGVISYFYVLKKNYSFIKYFVIRLYFLLTFLIKPTKWFLIPLIIKGIPLSESLKQQQQIQL